jgi:HD-GYP domain-containing protein (c-di-GMP phosphodiesterase class II)
LLNALITSRTTPLNTTVLARLAERWRPVGIYLACLDRDGAMLWHDAQIPRILAMCLTIDSGIPHQIKRLGEAVTAEGVRLHAQIPWIQMQLQPILKRRKVAGWIILVGRTEHANPTSEELARFAQRASMDAQALVSLSHKAPLVPAPLFSALVRVAEHMHEDLQSLANSHGELANVTEQLSSVYEELSLLSKISSGMRFSQKPQAFLESVAREVQEIGDFRALLVALLRRPDDQAEVEFDDASVVIGDCGVDSAALVRVLHEPIHDALTVGETQVHNEIAPDCDWARLSDRLRRFVCVPLVRDNRAFGVLLAVDKNAGTEFSSVDLKLLNNVGNQCAIFLENAALYMDMQDLFMGVLHALTRSIDAKDAYTRGHSQRVAELSRALARKIGLTDEQCERVYLSGLLHDVGKIGVPEAVLTKPGRLTDEEFAAIRKHPAIGAQILGNIRQLQDIIPGVLCHHERWDGHGYPHLLSGENIPLMGRIICVADSFDAMSSTRTYRPALPLETVLCEITRCAGAQFDPALAKVFVTLDFTSYQNSIAEAQAAVSPPAAAAPGAALEAPT